ncbi:hypothetical protein MKZ72_11345 [Staphylococcus hominis subsp. hominis]|uniref:hypothetical protein n=1 Tax=Staphylococcus hominis TaxID=1290 RepID=UPI001F5C44BE|nr:hypothetical protein [Staphylococcus hominis]MCI3137812.1 hypothetical protein [Staphylococcus hominis subsp. hominis]
MSDEKYQSLKTSIKSLGFTDDYADTLINEIETQHDNNRSVDLYELLELDVPYTFDSVEMLDDNIIKFDDLNLQSIEFTRPNYQFKMVNGIKNEISSNIHLNLPNVKHTSNFEPMTPIFHQLSTELNLQLPKLEKQAYTKIDTLSVNEFSLAPKLKPINVSNAYNNFSTVSNINVVPIIANINEILNSTKLHVRTKPFIKKDKSLTLPKNMMNKPIMKYDFRPKVFIEEPKEINTLIELDTLPKVETVTHEFIEPIKIEYPPENIKSQYQAELSKIGFNIELNDVIPHIPSAELFKQNVERFKSLENVSHYYKAFKGFFTPFADDVARDVYEEYYSTNDVVMMYEVFKERIRDVIEEIGEIYIDKDIVENYMIETGENYNG